MQEKGGQGEQGEVWWDFNAGEKGAGDSAQERNRHADACTFACARELLPSPPPDDVDVPVRKRGEEKGRESLWKRVDLTKVLMMTKPFNAVAKVFLRENASQIFAELREKRALELSAKEAQDEKMRQEKVERSRRELEERAQKQSERWRQTLEDTEVHLYNTALATAVAFSNTQSETGFEEQAHRRSTRQRYLMEGSEGDSECEIRADSSRISEDHAVGTQSVSHEVPGPADGKVDRDLNAVEETGSFQRAQQSNEMEQRPEFLEETLEASTTADPEQVEGELGKMRREISMMHLSEDRARIGEECPSAMTDTKAGEMYEAEALHEDRAKGTQRSRSADKASFAAAEVSVKARMQRHIQNLLASEKLLKRQRKTARFMLPAPQPLEPEIALECAKRSIEEEYEFRREFGDGRPRCSAGTVLRPHFPTPPSCRPGQTVAESKSRLKLFVSQRTIPQTPPHWGVVAEPRVTRRHLRKDESLARIRERFSAIFSNVGEAFVFCDSYRVGYIELPSMKARLQQIGLSSRPDDVNGLDLERVFLLATGKNTSIMEFFQFCRQFTWHFPLSALQENALRRRASVSATGMSQGEKASMYAKDLAAVKKSRPNGPSLLADQLEDILLDPALFEKFCVIEGHSALQMGARRLSMDQREWLSLLIELQLLPREAIKHMFKSEKVGETVGEKPDNEAGFIGSTCQFLPLQRRLRRKLTKEEAVTAFFAGDTSDEKDGEMNFREYCTACLSVALILAGDGPRTPSPEEKEEGFDLQGWWRGVEQRTAATLIQARIRALCEMQRYHIAVVQHLKVQRALGKSQETASTKDANLQNDEDMIMQVMDELLERVERQVHHDHLEEVRMRGVERTLESLVETLETKEAASHARVAAEKEQRTAAHEADVANEVALWLEGLVGQVEDMDDEEELNQAEQILRQEPGFFKAQLIAAIKDRERIMATARIFGRDWHRQHRIQLETTRQEVKEDGRREFRAKNEEPFSFKHSAERGFTVSGQLQDLPSKNVWSVPLQNATDVGEELWRNPGDHHAAHHYEQPTLHSALHIETSDHKLPPVHLTQAATHLDQVFEGKEMAAGVCHSAARKFGKNLRHYIDKDCERLAMVFQEYFDSIEDCFVFINWRLDYSGILISDLKKALVRLRVVRDPPFSCFFKTVYGYNFSRMWRRAGADTDFSPLNWEQFECAFGWRPHGEKATDIMPTFQRRAHIFNYIIRKVIDFDKLEQRRSARAFACQKQMKKLDDKSFAERLRAVSSLEQIVAALGVAISVNKSDFDEDSLGKDEGRIEYSEIYVQLCHARNYFAKLGLIYVPPSFDLCDATKHVRSYADEFHDNAPAPNGASFNGTESREEGSNDFAGRRKESFAVLECEYQEICCLLENITGSGQTGTKYRDSDQHLHDPAQCSTLSRWKQCRHQFSLDQYPVREDRQKIHCGIERSESGWLVRHRRQLQLRIKPHQGCMDYDSMADRGKPLNVAPPPAAELGPISVEGFRSQLVFVKDVRGRTTTDVVQIIGGAAFSPHCTTDPPPQDHSKMWSSILNELMQTASKQRVHVTNELRSLYKQVKDDVAKSVDTSLLPEEEDRTGMEAGVLIIREASQFLRAKREQRAVRPSSDNLHGRAHMRGKSMLKHLDSRGLLTLRHRNTPIACKLEIGMSFSTYVLHKLAVTPIRKLIGLPNCSDRSSSRPLRWYSEKLSSSGRIGEVPRNARSMAHAAVIVDAQSGHLRRSKVAQNCRSQEDLDMCQPGARVPKALRCKSSSKTFLRTLSSVSTTTSGSALAQDTGNGALIDFWPDYLTSDVRLMAEDKLLHRKLTSAGKRVVLQWSDSFLNFHLADGAVTGECEKLGLGVMSLEKRKFSPTSKSLETTREREAGEWKQAQQEIAFQMLLMKPLEETRQKLSVLGWKFVEQEEDKKKEDGAHRTRAQMLRDEAVRKYMQDLDQRVSKEDDPRCTDQRKGRSDSTSLSPRLRSRAGTSVGSRPPTAQPARRARGKVPLVNSEGEAFGIHAVSFSSQASHGRRPNSAPVKHVKSQLGKISPNACGMGDTVSGSQSSSSFSAKYSPRPPAVPRTPPRPRLRQGQPDVSADGGMEMPRMLLETLHEGLTKKPGAVENDEPEQKPSMLWGSLRRTSSKRMSEKKLPKKKTFYPTHKSLREDLLPMFDQTDQLMPASEHNCPNGFSILDESQGNPRIPFSRTQLKMASMSRNTSEARSPNDSRDSDSVKESKQTHELATRLHKLKKLAFLRTLRKETDILSKQTLHMSSGPVRGKGLDIQDLRSKVHDIRADLYLNARGDS